MLVAGATVMAFVPAVYQQILRPTRQASRELGLLHTFDSPVLVFDQVSTCKNALMGNSVLQGLLLCMANSSFAFYLFGYQVHEKSVLLPLLPVTLLAASEPMLATAMPLLAIFSMWPLLKRDGLEIPYVGVAALFFAIAQRASTGPVPSQSISVSNEGKQVRGNLQQRRMVYGAACSFLGAALIHVSAWHFPAPVRYPYLHDAAFTAYSFAHFVLVWGYLNWRQWHQRAIEHHCTKCL